MIGFPGRVHSRRIRSGITTHAPTGAIANKLAVELFKNSVEIPGPQTESAGPRGARRQCLCGDGRLREAPQHHGDDVQHAASFSARRPASSASTRRSCRPSASGIVHTGGYGDTFGAFHTEFGPMIGLICGENSNPLAVFALIAEGTRIHVMSWPNHFPTSGDPLRNRVTIDSQAFAQMSKAFVISACGTVDDRMIEMLKPRPEAEKIPAQSGLLRWQRDRRSQLSRVIAGPHGAPRKTSSMPSAISTSGIQMKLRHDFAGHYNRPDSFQVHVNRAAPTALPRCTTTRPALERHETNELPSPPLRISPPTNSPSTVIHHGRF